MPKSELAIIRETAQALGRMLAGERLTLADLETQQGPERPALRKRLRTLVDALVPHTGRTGAGQGRTEEFWWTWPQERRSRPEQVWALASARALLGAFNDTEVGRVLTDLLEDHRARLGEDPPPLMDLSRMFHASSRLLNPIGLDASTVDTVAQAIAARHTLQFHYTRFTGKQMAVEVEPWTLLLAHDGIYLFALCTDCDDVEYIDCRRVFSLARIASPKSTRKVFSYPVRAAYDPEKLFASCWGLMVPAPNDGGPVDVILRLAPDWSSFLSRQKLHVTQEDPEVEEDGRLRVRMKLHITYDLVHWIRGHGKEIEVALPRLLRDWVTSGEGGEAYRRRVLGAAARTSAVPEP